MARHGSSDARRPEVWALTALAVVIAAIAVGAVLTWPAHRAPVRPVERYPATVVSVHRAPCPPASSGCTVEVGVRITDGQARGATARLTFVAGATDPRLSVGQHIAVNRSGDGNDAVYGFADVQRTRPVLILVLLFIVVAVLVGRLRGLAALAGLLFAGAVLIVYLIPALRSGQSPLWVSLVGGAAIAVVAMPVAHGVSLRSAVALLGSLIGMCLSALICQLSLGALHFTGLSGDEASTLQVLGSRVTVPGLILCACVIGALGVLNDITITQAGAVFELADATPGFDRVRLTTAAMRIGRDHIASTVYSLVLAYAGASLPVLLLFAATGQSLVTILTSDAVGPALISGLIGAVALILMVPFTTAVAAAVVRRPRLAAAA